MATIIHSQNFSLTEAIRTHIDHRISVSLKRFQDRISMAEVFIKDLNGPDKHGEDLKVVIRIQLRGVGRVVVFSTSDDLYVAISEAARRSKRAVKRNLGRSHRIERRKLRHLSFESPSGLVNV